MKTIINMVKTVSQPSLVVQDLCKVQSAFNLQKSGKTKNFDQNHQSCYLVSGLFCKSRPSSCPIKSYHLEFTVIKTESSIFYLKKKQKVVIVMYELHQAQIQPLTSEITVFDVTLHSLSLLLRVLPIHPLTTQEMKFKNNM